MALPKPGVQERILLHLRDYADFASAVEVPFSLSQMGIANAVAIARSNVPRAIASLKDDGLLIERQAHVAGVSRKRKAYFLTDGGLALAEDTWVRLQDFSFRVILASGDAKSSTLGEVGQILPFTMRIVDVIRYIDDNGVLDARNLSEDVIERDLSKHVEKQLVTSLEDLPRSRHFFGRETELENMVQLLEARPTTILVPGIAGIGKTTIASKLIERFTHRRNLFYHRCQDWEGSRSFLEAIADWLTNIGDTILFDYLAATPVPRPAESVRLITDAIAKYPCLIIVDDFHKVSDKNLHQTLQGLALAIMDLEEQVGLVIFSRSYRESIPMQDAEGKIVSIPMELTGLDQDASRSLLPAFGEMDEGQFQYIYHLSRGHPLVLELINRGAPATEFHETLENYISVEIFNKLSAEQKRVLSTLSVFRDSVPLQALVEQELKVDELDALVEQGLARNADGDTYDVHDLIREFLLQGLDDQTSISLHLHSAAWYKTQKESPDRDLELIHHLIRAKQSDEAAEQITASGAALVSNGHLELLNLIDKLDLSEVGPNLAAPVLQISGDVQILLGRFDDAEKTFADALEQAKKSDEKLVQAQILSSMADVNFKRGNNDEALEMHHSALEIFIKLEDSIWAARTYNNLGFLYRRRGDKPKAMEAYSNVEAIISEGEGAEICRARINLARAYLDLGEVELAREHAFVAHSETDDLGDSALHSRARAVLGRYYAKVNDAELALHHYSEALELMGEAGDPLALVEITLLLGEVLVDSGRFEEALEQYREGLIIAEANDLRMQIGELLSRLGGVATDKQRRMEYLQRALSVFRELGAQTRMREVQMMVHTAVMGR